MSGAPSAAPRCVATPLTGQPPAGKKVYWLEGNIQSILPITQGFKDAASALGWNLTVLTYDPSSSGALAYTEAARELARQPFLEVAS